MASVPNPNRYSSYSVASHRTSSSALKGSSQVSTQTLLTSLHTAYSAGNAYSLDTSTSLVVNTWVTVGFQGTDGSQGGTVDAELAKRAWEHAWRRVEDGCVILGSLHESTPSLFAPFIVNLPLSLPQTLSAALTAIHPFLNCMTPKNANTNRASSIAATFSLTTTGTLTGASLRISKSGLDTQKGLLHLPPKDGYRAFDVFYYLLSSASTQGEREALGLKHPSSYTLLKKSETYSPPPYLPTADDAASAEDFRSALTALGIIGSSRRGLLSTLAALLKLGETLGSLLDEDELDTSCEDAASLLGIDTELLKSSTADRQILVAGVYEALVDWVLVKANDAIAADIARIRSQNGTMAPSTIEDGDIVNLTILELPHEELGKAVALKTVFDDSDGINAEMKLDDVPVTAAGHSVVTEMRAAVAACEIDLGIENGPAGREKDQQRDRKIRVLDRVVQEADDDSFLRIILYPVPGQGISIGRYGRFDLPTIIGSSRAWFHLSIHPTDALPSELSPNAPAWSAGSVSRQLRAWRLPEWANRRNRQLDFTADFDFEEFCSRYVRLGCKEGKDGIEMFSLERGWSNGEVVIGKERVWIREGAWWDAETMLEMLPPDVARSASIAGTNYGPTNAGENLYRSQFGDDGSVIESRDNLLHRNRSTNTLGAASQWGARSLAPTPGTTSRNTSYGDYGLGNKGDAYNPDEPIMDAELADQKRVVSVATTTGRRIWVAAVWMLTFWIPSSLLKYVGRMKRPDIRMAWREKLVLVLGIFLLNATIIFYIIIFGQLLCPNFDKAWNSEQVGFHQGDNDFYVSVRGSVYDISKFWRLQHSSISAQLVTSAAMEPLAGQDVSYMFQISPAASCPGLVSNDALTLSYNLTAVNAEVQQGFSHIGGAQSFFQNTAPLNDKNFYWDTFLPRMKDYYVGELVTSSSTITSQGQDEQYPWFTLGSDIYDLSNYFYTISSNAGYTVYQWLDEDFTNAVQQNAGGDMTSYMENWAKSNSTAAKLTTTCLQNQFYIGQTDFRQTARCQANNYILLAFTIILCVVILTKFLAALQLGSKKRPVAQDKFVICQVPAYTEGEDHLRKGLDSLTALAYDNKRKLICVICDGMIIGGGNDRPTPKIVLDILGVDPKIDPPALPFQSVGQGGEQLNYGKVYSGLYEYEGNVVPYLVVVKVGKESEQGKSKPGNRGKRDSQILLMRFLNRVHSGKPMCPLELEIFHQLNNIIGVDPELYEYLFMVDADTMVEEDALNRLVAACANDAKIAGICGETSLENEERSWWTMIQVYEYFISHHLAKSFESLFGSVTCLPGCFCMYRLLTDKGKPLIISDLVVDEYADIDIDTLHKKNLLSLGEDRYLTTLMTKHFPHMSYKFVPGAKALTAAPETWSILLSQRRRWINSTIHNLAELVWLPNLCGFCCFSMRFVVFVDLFGTLILPATCAYLGYLIYRVASHTGQFPLISIIMIAAVYGLQAVIFIIKRQWQHVGWMIIYILAYPVYSLILPIYAFWKQDDFSWGNTRIVIGEKGDKKVLSLDDEVFDERSIPLQRWDDYAQQNNLPGARGPMGMASPAFDRGVANGYEDGGYEMDDVHHDKRSMYSFANPASTILTGLKSQWPAGLYMPPQSPAPFAQRPSMVQRQSTYSDFASYMDHPVQQSSQTHLMAHPNSSDLTFQHQQIMQHRMSPYMSGSPVPYQSQSQFASQVDLLGGQTTPLNRAGTASPGPGAFFQLSRPTSVIPDFQTHISGQAQVSDQAIVGTIQTVLSQVDLDHVTKKQVRALVEQRLQAQLPPEKRLFLDEQIDIELSNM